MPVLPEYSGGDPDSIYKAFDSGQSWAARQQQMAIQRERQDWDREQYEIERPLKMAKARADIAGYGDELAGHVQMNDLLATAKTEMPQIRQAWIDSIKENDPKQRLLRQEQVLGLADKYAGIKGIGEEVKQWHNLFAQGAINDRARDQVMGRREVADVQTQSAQEVARIKAEAEAQVAEQRINHQQEILQVKQDNARELQALRQKSQVETSSQIEQNKGAYKDNQKLIDSGREATRTVANLDRGIQLLDDPDVRTGTGAGAEIKLERLGTLLGVESKELKKKEQLQSILGDAILARVNQTKGSISDKEMALFDNYSASINKTPEGNKAILTALKRAKEREVDMAKMINVARRAGKSESEIQADVNDFVLQNDIWSGLKVPGIEMPKDGSTGWNDAKEARLNELRAKLGK